MLFQQILTGSSPYFVNRGHMEHFLAHRHPEVELNYCISGSCKIRIDNHLYTMNEGDVAVIGSMVSHEVPAGNVFCQALTLEAGSVLLKDQFGYFSDVEFAHPVYRLENSDEKAIRFREKVGILCMEIAENDTVVSESGNLQTLGNLYKIYGYVLDEIMANRNVRKRKPKDFRAVENVERALGLIYNCYSESISIEDAAALTGYNKSNFCKIFKSIAGDSFHQVLNRYRIEVASGLLYETKLSIEEIAVAVGFADAKAFGRVFKAMVGETPGQYRKAKENEVNFCE